MAAPPKDPKQFIEIAYFNRDICIESAKLAKSEARKDELRRLAAMWEKFAANVENHMALITESRELLSKLDKLQL